jgi:hypothetical protein
MLDNHPPVAESGCRSLLFLKENSAYEEKWEGTKFGTRQEPQVEFSVKVAIAYFFESQC